MKVKILEIYKKLYDNLGPQHWWPAKTPFEVIVGAILTQSTNWKNVEKAIASLRKHHLLRPEKIEDSRASSLERRIKPAGYFRQKTRKLKAFVNHLFAYRKGQLKRLFSQSIPELRKELLSIHGIGPETADSIILYAAGKPSFVVDAYTKRIGHRLGLFKYNKYDEIKAFFERNLPRSVKIYNEFHALLVELGKRFCRKKPLCKLCALRRLCQFSQLGRLSQL